MVDHLTLAPATPRQIAAGAALTGLRELIFIQEPTNKGGTKLTFLNYWSSGTGSRKRSHSKTLATILLKPKDYKIKVAWIVKMLPLVRGKYPVNIAFDNNIDITIKKELSLGDDRFEVPFLTLKFHKVRSGPLVRPNQRNSYRFHELNDSRRLYRMRVTSLSPDHGIQFLIDLILGSIPIIGDIMDVGEFIYALVTRTDRWGDEVEDWQIWAMGIAVLVPGRAITSHFSRMRRLNIAMGQHAAIISSVRRINNLSELIDFHRLHLLPNTVINELTDEQLGMLLNSISKNFSMTGIRDLKLSRLLNY